jgi:hypothetical protein
MKDKRNPFTSILHLINGFLGEAFSVFYYKEWTSLSWRADQLVEQAKKQEGGWPLAYENAPVTLTHEEEGCGGNNGCHSSPIPYGSWNLVRYAKELVLHVLCATGG